MGCLCVGSCEQECIKQDHGVKARDECRWASQRRVRAKERTGLAEVEVSSCVCTRQQRKLTRSSRHPGSAPRARPHILRRFQVLGLRLVVPKEHGYEQNEQRRHGRQQ